MLHQTQKKISAFKMCALKKVISKVKSQSSITSNLENLHIPERQ